MDENTTEALPSSPPSFMTQSSEKIEAAQSAAQKAAAREENAQNKDDLAIRLATLDKSITRVVEMTEYMGRIDTVIAKALPEFIQAHPIGQVVDNFVRLEDAVEAFDAKWKEVKSRIDYAREVSFPARLDNDETKTFTSADSGHRVSRTSRIFASILPGLQEKAFDWLRSHELGSLIKPTVNSSSLSGAAKELMENGSELPDDIFRLHTKDGISITRKKAK